MTLILMSFSFKTVGIQLKQLSPRKTVFADSNLIKLFNFSYKYRLAMLQKAKDCRRPTLRPKVCLAISKWLFVAQSL